MHISIIIPHWNTPKNLKKLLSALDTKHEIIIIDNASKQSPSWIQKEFPHTHLIANSANRGYAFACNQGAAIAQGEWLLFLNPDVSITSQEINRLVSEAEQNKIDAFCPLSQDEAYSKPIPSLWSILSEFTPLKKLGIRYSSDTKTLWGGCLFIKSTVLKKLQGWDERFFLWFEDSDLTKRLKDNKFNIGYLLSTAAHEGGVAFKQVDSQLKKDIFFHSLEIYAKKHFSFFPQLIITLVKKRYTKNKVLPVLNSGTSIIVPNLKKDLLDQFLKQNKDYLKEIDELIIVTSALDEDVIWKYRKFYPFIRFINIEKNKGFAHTVNIGLRVSTGEYRGTINDDVELSYKWIETCLKYVTNNTGSINPVIYKTDKSIETAGIDILPYGKAKPLTQIDSARDCREVEATNGAAVLYTYEALNAVGILDEKFGSYLEDIDLSLRIKRAGYKNIVCYRAGIIHQAHATSRSTLRLKKQWLDFRNWIYVILKNWSITQLIIYAPLILLERLRNFSGIIKAILKTSFD